MKLPSRGGKEEGCGVEETQPHQHGPHQAIS